MSDNKLKPGMLITLYNCYYSGYENLTRVSPKISGMYIKTGREAQFEFYEIAVIKDETGKGGYVGRYLTSDFIMTPLSK